MGIQGDLVIPRVSPIINSWLGQHLLIPYFPSPTHMPFIPTALVIIIVIRDL